MFKKNEPKRKIWTYGEADIYVDQLHKKQAKVGNNPAEINRYVKNLLPEEKDLVLTVLSARYHQLFLEHVNR